MSQTSPVRDYPPFQRSTEGQLRVLLVYVYIRLSQRASAGLLRRCYTLCYLRGLSKPFIGNKGGSGGEMGDPVWATSLTKDKGSRSLEGLMSPAKPFEGSIPLECVRPSFVPQAAVGIALQNGSGYIQNRLRLSRYSKYIHTYASDSKGATNRPCKAYFPLQTNIIFSSSWLHKP